MMAGYSLDQNSVRRTPHVKEFCKHNKIKFKYEIQRVRSVKK